MESVRDLVRRRIGEMGLEMAGLSRAIGKNHAYLFQYLEKEKPRVLPEDAREKLAPLLGLQPEQLRGGPSSPASTAQGPIKNHFVSLGLGNELLPILGVAEGGNGDVSVWNGEIVDRIPRPPYLIGAPQAYGIYAVGESMVPRYEPGELLQIHPGKPITIGCYVLVQLLPVKEGDPPRAMFKRLKKRLSNKLVLEQFNPPKTFEIPIEQVVSMHRIVGAGDY